MKLAVIELDGSRVVNNQSSVVRIAVGVEFHNGKASPNVVLHTGVLKCLHFGSVHAAHDGGIRIHRQAVQGILGKDDQIHRAEILAGLGHQLANAGGLLRQILRRDDVGELVLDQANHHPVGALVETSQAAAHGWCDL